MAADTLASMRSLVLAVALVLASSLGASSARADLELRKEHMQLSMEQYFSGEVVDGWVFAVAGVTSIATGAGLLSLDSDLLYGMAFPLMGVGLVQLGLGLALLLRTPGQTDDLRLLLHADPVRYRTDELDRMHGVNRNFNLFKVIEIGLLVGGLFTAVVGENTFSPKLTGIGIGVMIQSLIMFTLDIFAEERADSYTEQLRRFNLDLVVGSDDGRAAFLAVARGRF